MVVLSTFWLCYFAGAQVTILIILVWVYIHIKLSEYVINIRKMCDTLCKSSQTWTTWKMKLYISFWCSMHQQKYRHVGHPHRLRTTSRQRCQHSFMIKTGGISDGWSGTAVSKERHTLWLDWCNDRSRDRQSLRKIWGTRRSYDDRDNGACSAITGRISRGNVAANTARKSI